jgi:WD40 repeat protein
LQADPSPLSRPEQELAGDDGTARAWKVPVGQEGRKVTHRGTVRGVAVSPDGVLLATASYDRTAKGMAVGSMSAGRRIGQMT